MAGTGNDFIILDLRRRRMHGALPHLARQLCQRVLSVGADGLLTVEPSRRADVKMRVINPDGSEAAMCGNGSRCVAWYAAGYRAGASLTIETNAGVIRARTLAHRRVRVTLTTPSAVRPQRLTVDKRPLTVYRVDTGVPHAVVIMPQIHRVDVRTLGRIIRHHRRFRPAGTNVDVVQILNRHRLRLRTYERGVEAETWACGTGAVAAALVAAHLRRCGSPVTVLPTSGEPLTIRFHRAGTGWSHVSLEGAVHRVFEGALIA